MTWIITYQYGRIHDFYEGEIHVQGKDIHEAAANADIELCSLGDYLIISAVIEA